MENDIKTSVLIVDDDINTCETLSDIFKLKGFQVIIKNNGAEGLGVMQSHQVDVALLDIKLPDMEGLELLDKMRQRTPGLIAIIITGHASVEYVKRALAQGANGFFVKPLILEEIFHVIDEALEKRTLSRRYQETSAQLKNIIEASHDAIFATDHDGVIQKYNKAAEQIFGYSGDELLQMNIGLLLGGQGDDDEIEIFQQYRNIDSPEEIFGRNNKGDILYLEITSGSFEERGDKIYSLIIRDISTRKKHEAEKRKLQSQLVQAIKMEAIGTLAGGVAHDFNNILTAILGYSQMINDTLENGSKAKKDMAQVLTAGVRATELVRQILAFSRKSEQHAQPVVVSLIVKEAIELLRSSIPKNIDIVTTFNDKQATVLINPAQFHQVVMNLCVNGYHAMSENGTLEVTLSKVTMTDGEVRMFSLDDTKEYLKVIVRDTGKGITPSNIDKIFDPYFTTKEKGEGTGLGLSTVRGIVLEAGGNIGVESNLGVGTVFTIYLPVIEEKTVPDTLLENSVNPKGCERILFIDDEMPIAELGRRTLEKLGYDVLSISCSMTALSHFREKPDDFDMIFSDNSMPGMTGSQLAYEIYKIRPHIPMILATGFEGSVNKAILTDTGVKKILSKPISRKQLSASIREIFDGKTKVE